MIFALLLTALVAVWALAGVYLGRRERAERVEDEIEMARRWPAGE